MLLLILLRLIILLLQYNGYTYENLQALPSTGNFTTAASDSSILNHIKSTLSASSNSQSEL